MNSPNAPSSPSAGRFQFPAPDSHQLTGFACHALSHQLRASRAYLVSSLRSVAILPHGRSGEEDAAGRLRAAWHVATQGKAKSACSSWHEAGSQHREGTL
jgi:hypothetical protein